MSGASCESVMRPPILSAVAGALGQVSGASRVTCRRRSRPPSIGQVPELGQIGKIVRGLRAVQQPHPTLLTPQECLSNHRPDRRDARAAGDEQEVPLLRMSRKHEGAEGPLNPQPHPGGDTIELMAPPPGRLDLDQKIEPAVLEGLDWRRCDGVGNPDVVLRRTDERRLTRFEGERRALQIEPYDSRRGCSRYDGLDGEDERVGWHGQY